MSEEIRKLFPKDMKYIEAQPIANYIEQLQQENKQLKERYRIRSEAYNKVLLENASLKDKVDLYKEIVEEVKESKDEYVCTEEYCGEVGIETTNFIEKLGQILDKIKEVK